MEVRPESLTTGVPVTVVVDAQTTGDLRVSPIDQVAAQAFVVPLQFRGRERVGQFSIALSGRYVLETSAERKEIQVVTHRYLAFTEEFGLFFVAVVFLVGGMVLWLRHQKRNEKPAGGHS